MQTLLEVALTLAAVVLPLLLAYWLVGRQLLNGRQRRDGGSSRHR